MTSEINLSAIFGEVQSKLEQNITIMVENIRSEGKVYKELHDNIMAMPYIVKILEENKMLKEQLALYENKRIQLEVVEKIHPYPTHVRNIIYSDDGETMLTVDTHDCELCSKVINCNKRTVHILKKGEETMILCFVCLSLIHISEPTRPY